MKAPTQQQLSDPKWWDATAPFDAEYVAIAPDNTLIFYRQDSVCTWQIWGANSQEWLFDGFSHDAGGPPYELIPRPAKLEQSDYDRSIHSNPDHMAWAKFFVETFPNCGVDEDTMGGWFANAMMARHDFDAKPEPKEWSGEGLPPVGCEVEMSLGFHCGIQAKITYMGDGVFCYRNLRNGGEYTGAVSDSTFRPLRTQAVRNAERDRFELARDLLDDLSALDINVSGKTATALAVSFMNRGWRKGDS